MKMVKNSVFQGGKLILGAKENFELSELFSPTLGMGLRSLNQSELVLTRIFRFQRKW